MSGRTAVHTRIGRARIDQGGEAHDVFASEIRNHSVRARRSCSGSQAWRHPHFAARLKERNLVAQIKARDEGTGRWIELRDGKIRSRAGHAPEARHHAAFKNATIGASLLTPPINWLNQINAQKDFVLGVEGSEDLTNWFAQTLMMMQTAHWSFGTPMPDGSMRYCNMANGGPLFVYRQGRQDHPHHADRL